MKNDGKTSSAPSLPQPSLASSTFDEEKQATLSTLAQVRESLRDKARLEELVSALTREKDALTKLFVPPPEGEQKESDALTDFQRVVDELAAFCRENSLEHLGKKTDKIITQFVQSAELSLGKVTSAAQPPSQPTASPSTPAPKDQKQQQQRLRKKTPTTQARRSAILLCGGGGGSSSSGANSNSPSGGGGNNNNLGKRFVINPPSSSRSVSASDSGSEGAGSVEQDVPSTPSQSKKKGKSKGSDTERVQSPFALSMALPGLSTTSQLKKKRSLCLTGVGGGDSGLMLQGSRRRSTVVGRSPLSDQTAALDKESVQKGCETMLKQIGVLEKICLLKKSIALNTNVHVCFAIIIHL